VAKCVEEASINWVQGTLALLYIEKLLYIESILQVINQIFEVIVNYR